MDETVLSVRDRPLRAPFAMRDLPLDRATFGSIRFNSYVFQSGNDSWTTSRAEGDSYRQVTINTVLLADPSLLRFVTGRRRKAWSRNCVALGLAAGFLEPLESTSIYLIQSGIARLLVLFPDRTCNDIEIDEYNRLTELQMEQIRDFIILHYKLTQRDDSPFWRQCASMEIPQTLTRKMELFRRRARFFRYPDELFSEGSWLAVMLGQNLKPERYDPLVDMLPADNTVAVLRRMQAPVRQAAESLPMHEEFIARHCAAALSI